MSGANLATALANYFASNQRTRARPRFESLRFFPSSAASLSARCRVLITPRNPLTTKTTGQSLNSCAHDDSEAAPAKPISESPIERWLAARFRAGQRDFNDFVASLVDIFRTIEKGVMQTPVRINPAGEAVVPATD
jgi:hypothetical protein